MRNAKIGGPGTNTRTEGKTSITSTMTPAVGKKNAGRKSASRLKSRPMTGR